MIQSANEASLVELLSTGTASVKVLSENVHRLWCLFQNDSDTETIYVTLGKPAVANQGIRLVPSGGWFAITRENPFTGEVYAISASALTDKLLITEVSR